MAMADFSRRELLGAAPALSIAAAAARPNILFICADNFNASVTGFAGHPLVRTPNLDRLARESTSFANCYAGSPVCAPARAGLMTGLFPSDVESYCNATPFRGDVPTWGDRLREAGYYTRAVGKMDLTHRTDVGFEQVLTKHEHEPGPDITALFRRPLCYRVEERPDIEGKVLLREHADVEVMEAGLKFLREDAPKRRDPWALYVGYIGPLPGFTAERRYLQMYPPDRVDLPRIPEGYLQRIPEPWEATRSYKRIATPIPEERIRRARAAYYANVTAVDERIGQLLQQLDRSGLRDKTIVVYTVDHGRSLGEHGLWFHNEPTDSSSKVTLLISGPGVPRGKRIDTPVMHADLFPTLMDLAQSPTPGGLRGHSLLPMCQGQRGNHPGFAYSECHAEGTCTGSFIIRKGKWKYIHYVDYDSLLFDIEQDPGEYRDVITTPEGRAVSRELHQVLLSLVDPAERTQKAFARQEQMLQDLCARMSLQELLNFGFERRLGRGQALTLLRKYKKSSTQF
jgi:choline-sulfatase